MTEPRYDVIAIGNAIVDVMSPCTEELIDELDLNKGGMTLVDEDGAQRLYEAMGPAREISGGSAANTLAGMSALGAQCAFVGQVAKDQLGDVFTHDIRAVGIDFDTPSRDGQPSTARTSITPWRVWKTRSTLGSTVPLYLSLLLRKGESTATEIQES